VVEKRSLPKGESTAGIASEAAGSGEHAAEDVVVAESASFTSEELREFLDADMAGDLADPEFKERLRLRLWEIVRWRAEGLPPDGD
jgi:hypothetical protein